MNNAVLLGYKGYMVEYIKEREHYRVYDPVSPAQTIAYTDSFIEAMDGIDKQCPEKKEILNYSPLASRVDRFTIVDQIPDSRYHVWNIGDNMIDGFLPLCCKLPSEFDWQELVDPASLVAIDMRDRLDVLADMRKAAGVGITNLERVYKALGTVTTTGLGKQQKEWAQVLLPVYEELSSNFIENLRGR